MVKKRGKNYRHEHKKDIEGIFIPAGLFIGLGAGFVLMATAKLTKKK